jgi:deoxyribodipyrimidine photo-lyase
MNAHRRLAWNHALDRSVELCHALDRPLLILEAIRCDHLHACARFHRFVLDGMAEHARACRDTPVRYYPFVERGPGQGKGLVAALAADACAVVTDDAPVFFLPRMIRAAARQMDVAMEAVDSCGIVPVSAPGKAYPTAYSFRRWVQKHADELLADRPRPRPLAGRPLPAFGRVPAGVPGRWPEPSTAELESPGFLATLPIDPRVGPVDGVRGGHAAARERLRTFLDGGALDTYHERRNSLEDNVSSGLSPWLHFGHLSSHEILDEIVTREDWNPGRVTPPANGRREGWWGMSPGAEGFLDQLITWRELGYNNARFVEGHDRWESLPDWARATLLDHAGDERTHVYGRAQFEAAATHDELWNAAQRRLVTEGVIHNYVRMLWGKKVLEWTRHPQEAAEILVHLNDKYALDGRNPNSYTGIYWVLGRHDRPWGPERPVYGKVRFMSSANTARKFDVKPYLRRHAERGLF